MDISFVSMSCVHIVPYSMRKRLKFIYLPVDWLDTTVHFIYGLSLCMNECICVHVFIVLLSTRALINFSQNALQLNGKLFVCHSCERTLRTNTHAHTFSHTHTIDCCHFTLVAYVYESIIIYID